MCKIIVSKVTEARKFDLAAKQNVRKTVVSTKAARSSCMGTIASIVRAVGVISVSHIE